MTRRTWTLVAVVVAAAAALAIAGFVAMAHDGGHGVYTMMGERNVFGMGGGLPDRGFLRDGGDGWSWLYGLPWLAGGLLIGLGATLLVMRPRRQALVATGVPITDVPVTPPGVPGGDVASRWDQWHREAHAAEAVTRPDVAGARAESPPVAGATETPAAQATTAETSAATKTAPETPPAAEAQAASAQPATPEATPEPAWDAPPPDAASGEEKPS